MAYHHTLTKALTFGKLVNDQGFDSRIQTELPKITSAIDLHWNGDYLWNTEVRPIDGSVLHAIVSFSYFDLND